MSDGFYWLIEGEVAGSSRPRSTAELDVWRSRGILAVVSLIEDRIDFDGFDVLHLPVVDLAAPSIFQLAAACEFIERQRAAGRPVVVHCLAGKGRTGTVLAALLIAHGLSALEAMERVRKAAPGSIETAGQEAALIEFAHRHGERTAASRLDGA